MFQAQAQTTKTVSAHITDHKIQSSGVAKYVISDDKMSVFWNGDQSLWGPSDFVQITYAYPVTVRETVYLLKMTKDKSAPTVVAFTQVKNLPKGFVAGKISSSDPSQHIIKQVVEQLQPLTREKTVSPPGIREGLFNIR